MIIDASVWISAFIRHDIFHERSRDWLRSQTGVEFLVPALACVEVAGAVSRIEQSTARGLRLSRLLRVSDSTSVVELSDTLMMRAADIAATLQLRGSDAVYVAVAEDFSLPLVTLDQELLHRAAPLVQVLQP